MTQANGESLERQLSALTHWEGGSTSLWRTAMASTSHRKAWRWLYRPISGRLVAAILLIMFPIGVVLSVGIPHLGRDRSSSSASTSGIGQGTYIHAEDDPGMVARDASDRWAEIRQSNETPKQFICPSTMVPLAYQYQANLPSQVGASSVRMVARKATMELAAFDVRATFHKTMYLIREVGGEYIQDSSLSGDEKNLCAQVTLRVAADRLSDVLNALRQLGTVRSENTEGQDVTAQVVDLDAQLRNERRVETEMLELLDKRHDAPLKDILDVREKLHDVRREIEKLTAQKEQLSRLVSLASVLVLIRNSASETTPPSKGIALYFKESCSAAWSRGLTFLADTVGFIVGIAVGGTILWVLALVIGLWVWRWRRQLSRDRRGSDR